MTGARKSTGLGYLSVTRHSDQATTYRAFSAVARVVIHFLLCSRCLFSSACLLRSPILPGRCCINHSKRPHEEFDKTRKPKRSVNSSLIYLELNMHNNNPRTQEVSIPNRVQNRASGRYSRSASYGNCTELLDDFELRILRNPILVSESALESLSRGDVITLNLTWEFTLQHLIDILGVFAVFAPNDEFLMSPSGRQASCLVSLGS